MTHHQAGEGPFGFLHRLRRRYLVFAFLGLCIPAAVINEFFRWSAFYGNRLFGWDLPFLNVGPYFLFATFLFTVRRWSLSHTASYADERLSFRDRLTSFLDFRSRNDLHPAITTAQAGEVSRQLGNRSPGDLLPVRLTHFLGPVLLAVSLFYPLLFLSGGSHPPFMGPMFRSDGDNVAMDTAGEAPVLSVPSASTAPDGGEPRSDLPGQSHGEQASAELRQDAGGVEGVESRGDGSSGEIVDEEAPVPPGSREDRTYEAANDDGEHIASKRVGLRLSPVVDPVFDGSSGSSEGEAELAGGTMSFRLIPKSSGGGEEESGATAAVAPPLRIDIDFESIPERYRNIVRRYFTDLERNMTKGSL